MPKSLYTVEEQAEIDTAQSLQAVGLEFVKRDIFNNIPIRTGKKSADPTAALWIEPIPIDPLSNKDTEGLHNITEVRSIGEDLQLAEIIYNVGIPCTIANYTGDSSGLSHWRTGGQDRQDQGVVQFIRDRIRFPCK